jgi:hypothetical protein
MPNVTFVEEYLAGNAGMSEIDDYVDLWHNSSQNCGLHEFLGFSLKEYRLWVKKPQALPLILAAKKKWREQMKLINTNRLTREQCIEIIEKGDSTDKSEVIEIINGIYNNSDRYIRSISVDRSIYVLEIV